MGGDLNICQTQIDDLVMVETKPYADSRGAFSRMFCERELHDIIGSRQIVQVNLSRTDVVGAVRGMHFQFAPFSEMKLVRCLKGRVWDVAVDLRANSPTFLKWHSQELSPANARMMVIPEGFAHGFQVLEPSSEILYMHTEFYAPQSEGGLRYNDPKLSIEWPLPISDLSKKDAGHQLIDSSFQGFNL
jgi:dTDP-4-dehydrorhamnose 3,5-epimerase